jgi:uncharacterized lipoprotein YmbA
MLNRALIACAIGALLVGCGGPDLRVAVPRAAVVERVPIAARSVEVREVSLPGYAASDDIFVDDGAGLIVSEADVLWADEPVRSVTLEIVRYLSQITGARVASEPWPFQSEAQLTVEIRIEQMLASADGTFRLAGHYFVGSPYGRERAQLFDLSVPLGAGAGPPAIAAARGQAVRALAVDIARRGLR